jgi:hypothetical protein
VSDAREGRIEPIARVILACFGVDYPTPEQDAAAQILVHSLNDIHVLAQGKILKE